MAEEPKAVRTIGRIRRVVGFCLLALGLIVAARDLWLGITCWSGFGAEERIRFVFWLWAGAVLTLAGCWLAFRLRGAGWALILLVASLALIVYSYGRWWS